jgi:PAT family beta-lactamase induction signal transducer AmpG
VIEPFREFIRRDGWKQALLVVSFIFLYKLGDSMATALATPFYLDMGFTKSESASSRRTPDCGPA